MVYQLTYHDEGTMQKVYRALIATGLPDQKITDVVMLLQNENILFREPVPDRDEPARYVPVKLRKHDPGCPAETGEADLSWCDCGYLQRSILRMGYEHTVPFIGREAPVRETYQDKARRIVIEHFNQIRDVTDSDPLEYKDTYVVWFSKTLQNWKALVSTHVSDGRYYEVTYNGDNKVTYLDVYVKVVNQEIPD